MPHKPPRFLKQPERKLRTVPRKQGSALARKHNLPRNSRFYYDMNGNMFCTYLGPESKKLNNWAAICLRLGSQEDVLFGMANIRFNPGDGAIEMHNVLKDKKRVGGMKGQMLFRALLNEALRIASAKKSPHIEISAENQKVASYYSKFGFKFDNPDYPLFGKLMLHKGAGK